MASAKAAWDNFIFQSTPPARGATKVWDYLSQAAQFQSTPPARGATAGCQRYSGRHSISIHAPREGGDCYLTDCTEPVH